MKVPGCPRPGLDATLESEDAGQCHSASASVTVRRSPWQGPPLAEATAGRGLGPKKPDLNRAGAQGALALAHGLASAGARLCRQLKVGTAGETSASTSTRGSWPRPPGERPAWAFQAWRIGAAERQLAGNVDDAKCGTIAFCRPSHGARLLNLSAQPLTTSFASTPDFSPRHLMHGNHPAAVADC